MEAELQEDLLTDIDLQSIYFKLSENESINFDFEEDQSFVIDLIEKLYDEKFRHIDSLVLQGNSNLLNNSFVKLVRLLLTEHKYKKIHIAFLAYCDYFDLQTDVVYPQLHDKIQKMIKVGCVQMVGKKTYLGLKHKYSEMDKGYHQPTLFAMLAKDKSKNTESVLTSDSYSENESNQDESQTEIQPDTQEDLLPEDIRQEFENNTSEDDDDGYSDDDDQYDEE